MRRTMHMLRGRARGLAASVLVGLVADHRRRAGRRGPRLALRGGRACPPSVRGRERAGLGGVRRRGGSRRPPRRDRQRDQQPGRPQPPDRALSLERRAGQLVRIRRERRHAGRPWAFPDLERDRIERPARRQDRRRQQRDGRVRRPCVRAVSLHDGGHPRRHIRDPRHHRSASSGRA